MIRVRVGVAAGLGFGLMLGAAGAAAGQDKSKFETKFEVGKPFYQELTTTVSQVVKVQGGADLPLKHTQTFYFKWEPVSVDKDKAVVKQTIEGVRMEVDIAGNPITYDSTRADPAGPAANPGLADFFKSLVGSQFTVTFGPGLKVEKVDGRDDFAKKLAGANPQMESLLKKILTDEAMREMTDPSAGVTPAGEQDVGSSWEKQTTLTLGPIGSYDRTFKYTYKPKDPANPDLLKVEIEPKLVYKAPADQADGLLFRIKSGTLETVKPQPGVILYDPKAGRVASSDVSITMEGKLDVTIGSTDTNVELYQQQKTITKTSDQSFLPKK